MSQKIKEVLSVIFNPLRRSRIDKSGTILSAWKLRFIIELEHNKLKNRSLIFTIERIVLIVVIVLTITMYADLFEMLIEFWTF